MVELITQRLKWRLPKAADFEALHHLVSDFEVVKWTGSWPYPADTEVTRRRCKPMDASRGFSGPVFLGDVLIGTMGVEKGEFGYMFSQLHWGNGYATEIGRAMIARAFATTDWERLTARTGQENAGSARVLEKLGFSRVGTGTCGSVAQGGDIVSFEYVLTRQDWLVINPLRIKTERLNIVPITENMATEFQAIAAPAEVASMMLSIPHPIDLWQAKDWIAQRQYQGRTGFSAGVTLDNGTLIGVIGIGRDPRSILYFLGTDYWGKGYATEMLTGFLKFCFDRFELKNISAQVLKTNMASRRVLEKQGFEYMGEIIVQSVANLEPETDCEYRLIREQFEARK